jgi:hypothetical protein
MAKITSCERFIFSSGYLVISEKIWTENFVFLQLLPGILLQTSPRTNNFVYTISSVQRSSFALPFIIAGPIKKQHAIFLLGLLTLLPPPPPSSAILSLPSPLPPNRSLAALPKSIET